MPPSHRRSERPGIRLARRRDFFVPDHVVVRDGVAFARQVAPPRPPPWACRTRRPRWPARCRPRPTHRESPGSAEGPATLPAFCRAQTPGSVRPPVRRSSSRPSHGDDPFVEHLGAIAGHDGARVAGDHGVGRHGGTHLDAHPVFGFDVGDKLRADFRRSRQAQQGDGGLWV